MEIFTKMEGTWGRITLTRLRDVCKYILLFWSLRFEMSFAYDQQDIQISGSMKKFGQIWITFGNSVLAKLFQTMGEKESTDRETNRTEI